MSPADQTEDSVPMPPGDRVPTPTDGPARNPSDDPAPASPVPAASRAARGPRPRRRRRARRPLRRRLLSENLRMMLSLVIAAGASAVLMIGVPSLNYAMADSPSTRITLLLLIVIIVISLHGLLFAILTYLALADQSHTRLVAAARLPRARKNVLFYRMFGGRSGPSAEVIQLLVMATIAIILLALRPEGVSVLALLILTVAAVVSVWIGTVMNFAVGYAAEDGHGGAFDIPATPGPERTLPEYVYAAVLFQTSTGVSEVVPLTRAARRLVRNHVILAHLTSTIIITLAVSVVITAVS